MADHYADGTYLWWHLSRPSPELTAALADGWLAARGRGERVLLADRWHTCFFDLSGDQGLLGQVEGRTADDTAYWLWQAGPAWRDRVQVVAIDMCSMYASAIRRALPGAQIVADLFHVVQLGAATPALTWPACRRDGIHKRYAVEVYSTV